MTKPVILPPITIAKGVEFFQRILFEDGGSPVDLTDWTGTFSLSERPFEKPFYTTDLVLGGVVGDVRVTIPVTDSASFEVDPVLGGSPVAYAQWYLVAPDQTKNQVWQAPAKIAGKF